MTAQSINPRLSTKIVQYTKESVTKVREMKRLLIILVKNDLFSGQNLPDSNNRQFYPNSSIIRSHIDRTKAKLRHSMIDQECFLYKIEEWKKADKKLSIFYTAKTKEQMEMENEPNSFLFWCKSKWQKYLSQHYGNELILLDATYKTTRYSLPVFFLTWKTNADYQIVATFATENEMTQSTTEALAIIKSWNLEVCPKYGMADYCNEEIDAVESVFSGLFFCLTPTKSGNFVYC